MFGLPTDYLLTPRFEPDGRRPDPENRPWKIFEFCPKLSVVVFYFYETTWVHIEYPSCHILEAYLCIKCLKWYPLGDWVSKRHKRRRKKLLRSKRRRNERKSFLKIETYVQVGRIERGKSSNKTFFILSAYFYE